MIVQKKENSPKALDLGDLARGSTYITEQGSMYLVDTNGLLVNLESGNRALASGGKVVFYRVDATVTWEYTK